MLGYQGRRSSVRDVGVGLLAQASNTYCAHDFAVYEYRNAAAQRHDIGGDKCRSALVDVVLDLGRRLFCRSLTQLGVRYTRNDAKNVSIARKESVARLDEFVGPKA